VEVRKTPTKAKGEKGEGAEVEKMPHRCKTNQGGKRSNLDCAGIRPYKGKQVSIRGSPEDKDWMGWYGTGICTTEEPVGKKEIQRGVGRSPT